MHDLGGNLPCNFVRQFTGMTGIYKLAFGPVTAGLQFQPSLVKDLKQSCAFLWIQLQSVHKKIQLLHSAHQAKAKRELLAGPWMHEANFRVVGTMGKQKAQATLDAVNIGSPEQEFYPADYSARQVAQQDERQGKPAIGRESQNNLHIALLGEYRTND
ncbi:MAG: hypothetical protein K8F90_00515 [Hyphomicrobiales bacterium]|nr:hypothetical protein [Hyphomicrobiales bacterium]